MQRIAYVGGNTITCHSSLGRRYKARRSLKVMGCVTVNCDYFNCTVASFYLNLQLGLVFITSVPSSPGLSRDCCSERRGCGNSCAAVGVQRLSVEAVIYYHQPLAPVTQNHRVLTIRQLEKLGTKSHLPCLSRLRAERQGGSLLCRCRPKSSCGRLLCHPPSFD
jgi:hypothetical protein